MAHSTGLALFFIFLLSSLQVQAQELSTALVSFIAELTTVEAGKYSYTQHLSFDEEKAYKLKIKVSKEGKKGVEEVQYGLNLADLNTRLINWKPKGDVIEFKIQTEQRQKFIEVIKDGELSDYVNELVLYATSSDNARTMEDKLKKCIAIAKPLFSAELEISSYEEGIEWLMGNIQAVSLKKEDINQELFQIEESAVLFQLLTEIDEKQEEFHFNMSDLRSPSVQMDVKGQEIAVNVKTEKALKYITTAKDGERGNFTNELKLLVASIDQGRMMKDVLSKTIEFSKAMSEERTPSFTTFAAGFPTAQSSIGRAAVRSGEVVQLLKGDCNATLQKNGKESEQFVFHFADLNPKTIDLKVSGKYLSVEIQTSNKEPLIQYYQDGELSKYVDELVFDIDDLEEAKQLKAILKKLAALCEKTRIYTFPTTGTNEAIANWLIANISALEAKSKDYQQVLEKLENDPCKLAFTQTISTDKKSSTEVFEFNLIDIDQRDIKYVIKGSELAVGVEATGNKKYIKHYKDDKVDDYVGSFKVFFTDVEVARNVRAALEALVKGCK